jgi:hypothetical protein
MSQLHLVCRCCASHLLLGSGQAEADNQILEGSRADTASLQVAYDRRRLAFEAAVAEALQWHEQALGVAERTPSSKPSTPQSSSSDPPGAPVAATVLHCGAASSSALLWCSVVVLHRVLCLGVTVRPTN